MAEDAKPSQVVVPYLSWATFTGFVAELSKKLPPPPQIDSSVLSSKAGSVQRQLKQTLGFFGLIRGEANEVTPRFRELIASHGTDKWKEQLELLLAAYEPIVGDLDIASATQRQLEDAMEKGGLKGGAPKEKASRFFSALAKEAGASLSPHFKQLRPGAAGRRVGASKPKASKPKAANGEATGVGQTNSAPPAGTQVIKPLPDLDFVVHLPETISEAETAFALRHLVDYLKLRKDWFKNVEVDFKPKPPIN